MITVEAALASKEHVAVFLGNFDGRKQFFFNCGVVDLDRIDFSTVEGNRPAVLSNNTAKLSIRSVGVNIKWLRKVRITQKDLACNNVADVFERLFMLVGPFPFGIRTSQLRKRSNGGGAMIPKLAIKVDKAKEFTELFSGRRASKRKN